MQAEINKFIFKIFEKFQLFFYLLLFGLRSRFDGNKRRLCSNQRIPIVSNWESHSNSFIRCHTCIQVKWCVNAVRFDVVRLQLDRYHSMQHPIRYKICDLFKNEKTIKSEDTWPSNSRIWARAANRCNASPCIYQPIIGLNRKENNKQRNKRYLKYIACIENNTDWFRTQTRMLYFFVE